MYPPKGPLRAATPCNARNWPASQFTMVLGGWSNRRSRGLLLSPCTETGLAARLEGCPPLLQALRYARDPLGFLIRLRERHGDIFMLDFPYFGKLVYVADPALVKAALHRPAAAPARGRGQRDGARAGAGAELGPHPRRGSAHAPAQAAAAPLPRRADRALRRADPRGDPQRDGELAGRRTVRPASAHATDHPGGDHARRLRRRRRGAAGPLRAKLIERLQQPGQRRSRPSRCCVATWAPEPLDALRARTRRARPRSSTKRSPCAGPRPAAAARRGPRRHPLAAARRRARRRQPDERRGAARRAGHRARRRPRDDRNRPRLGDGAAAAHPARADRSCANRSPPARTTTWRRRSRRRCGRGR